MPSSSPPRVADVVAALEREHPPAWAQDWDAVGLTVGDPDAPVRTVLLAVDPVRPVVDEAVAAGVDLLVTHHPLLLSGVDALPRSQPKGAVVHDLIRHDVALFTAHTNADVAPGGVNDALADALGLRDTVALVPAPDRPASLDQLTVFVPVAAAGRVLDALAGAGAGRLGRYDRAAFSSEGTGTFRPLPGAHPAVGRVGESERVAETRLEMVVPRGRRADVLAALRAAHPYEEPAFALVEHAALPGPPGLGRVGRLAEPTTLRAFVDAVAAALPATAAGVRAAGDPERRVETVAVCGGSGASEAGAARRAGADAYVTADLKHHATSEATTELGAGAMALVDPGHWASEWPWLPRLAGRLTTWFDGLDVRVSRTVTDPWTVHSMSREVVAP